MRNPDMFNEYNELLLHNTQLINMLKIRNEEIKKFNNWQTSYEVRERGLLREIKRLEDEREGKKCK